MLYIVRKNNRKVTWYVNCDKPVEIINSRTEVTEPFKDVCEIQADGHELEYIRKNFSNLPMCNHKRVVTWKGEWAQFIYDHLV